MYNKIAQKDGRLFCAREHCCPIETRRFSSVWLGTVHHDFEFYGIISSCGYYSVEYFPCYFVRHVDGDKVNIL